GGAARRADHPGAARRPPPSADPRHPARGAEEGGAGGTVQAGGARPAQGHSWGDEGVSAPVLVTGATGFLGSHLLALLRGRRPVRVLTRAATPELEATGAEIVEGSLLDPDALRKSLRGVRRVYHAAGLVSRDPRAAAEMYRVHVEGTRELLLAARAEGVSRVL